MTEDPLAVARALGAGLERAGARWVLGGSVASSLHGRPRSTVDLDVIVQIPFARMGDLERALTGFAVDGEALADAFLRGSSYNIFHDQTVTKVDLFPATGRFERAQIASARTVAGVPIATPEHAILAKLRWYRAGGQVSERQWTDVRGVVEVQGDRLDRAELAAWADELGVADLLAEALAHRL